MYNLFSVLTGIIITVMIACNGALAVATGDYSAALIIHAGGLVCMSIALLIGRAKIKFFKDIPIFQKDIPIYYYSAGLIGIVTILSNNISFIGLGATLTLALGLLGQTITSIVIDHFGLFKMKKIAFNKSKILGLGLIVIGIIVMTVL